MEMESVDAEYNSQADFIKNELNFDVDPNEPLTKAALNDAVEDEVMDILGNGQLKKKILVKGTKNTRPSRGTLCTLNLSGKLEDGKEVEKLESEVIYLGDAEVIQGLDLAIALMDVGEKSEIEIAGRFAYGELGLEPDIPPNATIFYEVELVNAEMEPDMNKLDFNQRRELGNRKRERGNWWFSRNEATVAAQCYRRALEFLSPSNDDTWRTSEEKFTDLELQTFLEDRTKIYNNLAAAQIKTEAYEAALESVRNVLRAEPNNIKALFRKGRILHKKGEHASAIAVLTQAAKLDPESREIQKELGILKELNIRNSIHEKNLYRKMLGTPATEKNNKTTARKTESKNESPSKRNKIAIWSLIGGSIVALTGVIVYRLTL